MEKKKDLFKSTEFGDDTDRALQKDDGSWTYFANDVAYHSDKINRKYDNLINILEQITQVTLKELLLQSQHYPIKGEVKLQGLSISETL